MNVTFDRVKFNGIFMYNGEWYVKIGNHSAKDPNSGMRGMTYTFRPDTVVYLDNAYYLAA